METIDLNKQRYTFKKEKDSIFPPMVFVEITNVCNLECIHCPYSIISKQQLYRPRHMKFDIYRKIIDEVAQYSGVILRLVCDGEPMVHPDFLGMIKYAIDKGIAPVCFNTNGTFLDEKKSLEILQHGVDLVEISIDAFKKETYEHIRRGANFEITISNAHKFIELRNRLKAKTRIMVSIIDQPEARSEISEFVNYWSLYVDRVIIRTYTSIGGLVDKDKLKLNKPEKRWPCPLLWTRVFVNTDGFVKFCVEDWLDNTILFHINDKAIRDVWVSSEYHKIRKNHALGRFQGVPYCKDCVDWPAREWNYDYFYAIKQMLNQ